MKNCELGDACSCGKAFRETCVHWKPSRGSKNYNCLKYQMERELCTCSKKQQPSCSFYIHTDKPGRPRVLKPKCAKCGAEATQEHPKDSLKLQPDFLPSSVNLCDRCAKFLV